jgi:translation elongation factor EF-Ts
VPGLNPQKIGSEDKPFEDMNEESFLIHQEYLLNNSYIVNEILAKNGIEIIDFKRFACRENYPDDKDVLLQANSC